MSAMDLGRLLEGIATVPRGETPKITGLALDSRRVRRGDLFLALPGMAADGRDFVGDAVASGASAVAYESGDGQAASGSPVPTIAVADLRDQLGRIADRFYGAPSRKLVVIGVTGTNGKTTCTHLLAQALDDGGSRAGARRCGIIGTLGHGFPGALDASRHTTPDALTVHRLMRGFLEAGASYVALEVSSHALDQGRVNAVAFDVAVFTNLTRDHLDYHGDMSAYGAAKAGLFGREGLRCAVINQDDAFGQDLLTRFRGRLKTLSYGLHGGDVTARSVTPTRSGLKLEVTTPQGAATLDSSLVGRFNAYNLLAVLATLLLLDVPLPEACARLQRARSPAGRAEHFGGRSGRSLVIVDYAHTPDALEQILRALREHTPGRLICVFGCGGDRDRGKRPLMGGIAERLADRVILTDDNPRTEAPERILDDIRAGMRQPARTVRDRRAAIAAALAEAAPEDIVLVAGKGHEDYQQVGETRLPYSDREAVRQLLGAAA